MLLPSRPVPGPVPADKPTSDQLLSDLLSLDLSGLSLAPRASGPVIVNKTKGSRPSSTSSQQAPSEPPGVPAKTAPLPGGPIKPAPPVPGVAMKMSPAAGPLYPSGVTMAAPAAKAGPQVAKGSVPPSAVPSSVVSKQEWPEGSPPPLLPCIRESLITASAIPRDVAVPGGRRRLCSAPRLAAGRVCCTPRARGPAGPQRGRPRRSPHRRLQ